MINFNIFWCYSVLKFFFCISGHVLNSAEYDTLFYIKVKCRILSIQQLQYIAVHRHLRLRKLKYAKIKIYEMAQLNYCVGRKSSN